MLLDFNSFSHSQRMEACFSQGKSISSTVPLIKLELAEQNDIEIIQRVHYLASEQLLLCKQTIKEIKKLQLHTFDKPKEKTLAKELKHLRQSKDEITLLKSKAEEKISLIQRRKALYGEETLPRIANFENLLSNIGKKNLLTNECSHFKLVVETAMGLQPGRLTPEDIDKLHEFAKQLENNPEHKELYEAVYNQWKSLQQAVERKEQLLLDLSLWIEEADLQNVSFEAWEKEDKIFLLSQANQIMNNPFEAKFDIDLFLQKSQEKSHSSSAIYFLSDLLKGLWKENTRTSNKKDFWNYAPSFEQKCHILADTPELKRYLHACKIEGLKKIIALRPNHLGQHLIIGAGPSGLISALSKKMQGLDYKIIERRGFLKLSRENTITLGKGDPKDLEILFFLGVMTKFVYEDTVSLGHNKAPLMEVKIGDVEEGLLSILEELHGSNPIEYNLQVTDITINDDDLASVSLKNLLSGKTTTHLPSTVTVTDGFSGKTKDLLGISRIDLAKPTMIAFSLFKNITPQEETILKTLQYRVGNTLKGLVFMLSVAICKIVKNTSWEESFAKAIKGGPSAIFRIPDQDYLIRVLRKKEQAILDSYRIKIKKLNGQMATLQTKAETDARLLKEKHLAKELREVSQGLNLRLQKHAEEVHGMLDFFQTLYNPTNHTMKKMAAESTADFLVDVQVGKAERNLIIVGKTPFLIRGDASHSTDPYAGYGCKTALEEVLADQNFYNNYQPNASNTVEFSMLQWGHESYQQAMIDIGLKERYFYRKRTERLERYIDRALTSEAIDEIEAGHFLRFAQKIKTSQKNSLIIINGEDKKFASDFQNKLKNLLKGSLNEKGFRLDEQQKLKNIFNVPLTKREERLLKRALQQALEDFPALNSSDIKKFEALCAKLTFNNVPEGWILALLFQPEVECLFK